MFDTSNQLGTQRYNADAYNTGGMFNASQGNQLGQFNAGQGNQLGMYGQGLRQQTNLANTGAANNFLTQGRNLYEQGRQFDQTLGQRGREFDANLDFGIDNSNWNRMRTGQQDQLNFLGQLFGFGNQGVGMANQLQNMPADQQAKWAQIATMLGGMGGTNSQNLQGDPLAGFLGGLGLGNGIYNYYTGGR